MDNTVDKIIITESAFISSDVAALLNHTAFVMPNWKWFSLVIVLILGLLLRPLVKFIFRQIKKHNPVAKRFPDSFTAHLFAQPIEQPLSWLSILLFWTAGMDVLNLPPKFDLYLGHFFKGFVAINIIVLLYYAVDAMKDVFLKISIKAPADYNFGGQLIPYASKTLKVLIVVLGVLIALQSFGLNVMSLLAGLGLGGLALALAAQDTAANLFGSITIMFDNPFKVGDWIKLKDVEGTVEDIGFRSTRIRTFYNSVITIPNAMIAKETVDNMGVRSARRITQTVGLTYETSPEKIEQFCYAVREMIKSQEKVHKETVGVNFSKYSDSSLDIAINFHLNVFANDEEAAIKENIFLNILKIATELKIDFAYPTITSYQRAVEALTPERSFSS